MRVCPRRRLRRRARRAPPSETVIQPTIEVAPGITIPFGPPTTVPVGPPGRPVPTRSGRRAGRAGRAGAAGSAGSGSATAATVIESGDTGATRGHWAAPLHGVAAAAGRRSCAAPTTATCPAEPTRSARRTVAGDRRTGGQARADRPRALPHPAAGDVHRSRVVFLALGYSTKAACLVTTGTGTADQKVANWQNQRAYYELCYSDTVPLYTAELLNLGKFPYKSSWIETDSQGRPQKQFDGNIAVRYMEYPVHHRHLPVRVDGAGQDVHRADASWLRFRSIAEVVMFFNISAFGLGAGLVGHGVGHVRDWRADASGTRRWSRVRRS